MHRTGRSAPWSTATPNQSGMKMNQPNVSVLLPVGRVDDELREQLDALGAQDFESTWEIILALNTTDPDQREQLDRLIQTRARVRIVDASDVRSAAHARNVGAEAASGEILALCDGDDIVEPDWLTNLVAALEPGTAVGGHLDEVRLAIPGQENWRPPATPGRLPTFLEHSYVVSANMALYRDDFGDAGGFDLSLIRCEDVAFSFKLLENGIELVYAERAVVHYRHRRGIRSLLQQHYLYGQGMAQVLARDGLPGGASQSGLGALRPNAQPVANWSVHQVLRRGSLGLGRIVGLVREKLRGRR